MITELNDDDDDDDSNPHKEPWKNRVQKQRKCPFLASSFVVFAEYEGMVKHSTCTSYFQQRKQLSSHLDAKQDAATSLCSQEHCCYSHRLQQYSLILLLFHHFNIFFTNLLPFSLTRKGERERDWPLPSILPSLDGLEGTGTCLLS